MCARSCAHIYDVRKRKGVVVHLHGYNVNNNNDIQNNDLYIHTHNYKAMHTIDATNFNRTYRFDGRAR